MHGTPMDFHVTPSDGLPWIIRWTPMDFHATSSEFHGTAMDVHGTPMVFRRTAQQGHQKAAFVMQLGDLSWDFSKGSSVQAFG